MSTCRSRSINFFETQEITQFNFLTTYLCKLQFVGVPLGRFFPVGSQFSFVNFTSMYGS